MSSVFKIYSLEDCDFYYDGELQGHIEGNSKKAFRFEVERKGMYRLEFINSEYETELMIKVSIDADEEREVELDFSEVNAPVSRERELERERIIIAIEHDYSEGERIPEEIISAISNNGIVTIPKSVRKIGKRAFQNCKSLTSLTIPDSVSEIGHLAFLKCSGLTSVTIPDSVSEIGHFAFLKCSSLTSVTIPDSVTKIGDYAFYDCNSMTTVYCKATTPPKLLAYGHIFNYVSDFKIYIPKSEGSTVLKAYKSAKGWKDYARIIEEYDYDNR